MLGPLEFLEEPLQLGVHPQQLFVEVLALSAVQPPDLLLGVVENVLHRRQDGLLHPLVLGVDYPPQAFVEALNFGRQGLQLLLDFLRQLAERAFGFLALQLLH